LAGENRQTAKHWVRIPLGSPLILSGNRLYMPMNKGLRSNCLFWSKMQFRAVCATFLSRIVTHIGRSECLNMGVSPKLTKDQYPDRCDCNLVSYNITERSKTVSGQRYYRIYRRCSPPATPCDGQQWREVSGVWTNRCRN
jgi:hypothetical protein